MPDVMLLAKPFADPVTAPNRTLAELDDQIEQLRNTEDDALIIRTAIAGFYADRLPGCREALLRVVRDGREGGERPIGRTSEGRGSPPALQAGASTARRRPGHRRAP